MANDTVICLTKAFFPQCFSLHRSTTKKYPNRVCSPCHSRARNCLLRSKRPHGQRCDPCSTLAISTASALPRYTAIKGRGENTNSRVPFVRPWRPLFGNDVSDATPSYIVWATRSAAEGFCLRMYSTIAVKSAAASGDQRTVIKTRGCARFADLLPHATQTCRYPTRPALFPLLPSTTLHGPGRPPPIPS